MDNMPPNELKCSPGTLLPTIPALLGFVHSKSFTPWATRPSYVSLEMPSASRNGRRTWHPSDVCASVSQPARVSADSDDTHRRDNTHSNTLPADSLRCRGCRPGPSCSADLSIGGYLEAAELQ